MAYPSDFRGSPPRMRGKGAQTKEYAVPQRITPAYAGKSSSSLGSVSAQWDHPRVCGEKLPVPHALRSVRGSPPRMRGKVRCRSVSETMPGITPAYAGKRRCTTASVVWFWDHPRVCGEKHTHLISGSPDMGSPPRMRGKDAACPCKPF